MLLVPKVLCWTISKIYKVHFKISFYEMLNRKTCMSSSLMYL